MLPFLLVLPLQWGPSEWEKITPNLKLNKKLIAFEFELYPSWKYFVVTFVNLHWCCRNACMLPSHSLQRAHQVLRRPRHPGPVQVRNLTLLYSSQASLGISLPIGHERFAPKGIKYLLKSWSYFNIWFPSWNDESVSWKQEHLFIKSLPL